MAIHKLPTQRMISTPGGAVVEYGYYDDLQDEVILRRFARPSRAEHLAFLGEVRRRVEDAPGEFVQNLPRRRPASASARGGRRSWLPGLLVATLMGAALAWRRSHSASPSAPPSPAARPDRTTSSQRLVHQQEGREFFSRWIRITHVVNLTCVTFLIRSGIQILMDHPKLYWNDHCTPGSEWLSFTRKQMPRDRLWTSMDEAETVNPVVALPGGHHQLGAGRQWHLLTAPVWMLNGLVYVGYLFLTSRWRRLMPTSWADLRACLGNIRTYVHFRLPDESEFNPFDPLQKLAYSSTVWVMAPWMIATGLGQSPAILARFPWYGRLFGGRQGARSLHFLGMLAFSGFIVIHVALVRLVYFQNNVRNIVLGSPDAEYQRALKIGVGALAGVALLHLGATLSTRRAPRQFQRLTDPLLNRLVGRLLGRLHSRQAYRPADISPYFRVNGYPPESGEYHRLAANGFRDWQLTIDGLVEQPLFLSLANLHALPKQEQITKHNCIQGWSGVAQWGGVRVRTILDHCRPRPNARYIAFHAFMQPEYDPQHYFEVFELHDMEDPQTILAYEMNGRPLPLEHGAPCRLRIETKLGYKMVKYLSRIELVASLDAVGEGQGGFREDVQYYNRMASI